MNKLNIPNGGMPLFGDDFRFLDEAGREALKGILFEAAQVYDGKMILGGCVLTVNPTTFSITEGFVMLDYEVLYLPATTVAKGGNTVCEIQLDVTYDPDGEKTFANSTTQDTYEVRRAKLVAGTSDNPDYIVLPTENNRTSDAIYSLLGDKATQSTAIGVTNSWLKEVANQPIVNRLFNQVSFVGGFVVGDIDGTSFTQFAQLPIGYRPAKRFKAIAAAYGIGVYGSVMIEVFENGEVYAIAVDVNTYDLVSVNVTFLAP
jgi:hypothetical protein